MDFLFKNIYKHLDRLFKSPTKIKETGDIRDKVYKVMMPLIPETKIIHYKKQIIFDHDEVEMLDTNGALRRNTIDLAEMPFETCFFETFDSRGLANFGGSELYRLTGRNYPTCAYWLHRTANGVIGLQLYKHPETNEIVSITDVTMVESMIPEAKRKTQLLMYVLTEPLTRGFLSQQCNFNIKWREKEGRKKKFCHVNEIVFVDPDIAVLATHSGDTSIEYSHRFWVRGHWRKIPGRSGFGPPPERKEVQGLTWVSAYIKGPDQKPLINKKWVIRN